MKVGLGTVGETEKCWAGREETASIPQDMVLLHVELASDPCKQNLPLEEGMTWQVGHVFGVNS